MIERVDRLVPYGHNDAQIGTFHAFGDRLLREHAFEAGLSDRSTVLGRAEQVIFLREHLFELPLDRYRPLGDPTRFLSALVTLFSRLRDEDVSPEQYAEVAQRLTDAAAAAPLDAALAERAANQAELAATYAAYERLMRTSDRLDFGDQVSLALRLLREHPAVLEEERGRYRYILVDEFQDTNHAQWELVRLLAAEPRQRHRRRRRRPVDLPLPWCRARQHPRLPRGVSGCRERRARRQLPQPAADPGRGASAHRPQRSGPAGGARGARQAAARALASSRGRSRRRARSS